VLLNWATPERIAVSRALADAGAARAGREPGSVPLTMYIRVCVDDDMAAARQALGIKRRRSWRTAESRLARRDASEAPSLRRPIASIFFQ